MENSPKKFFRLVPHREVRLQYAYYITCHGVKKDAKGKITELRFTCDPSTKDGDSPDGRKVKATLHWVSANHTVKAEDRLFNRLFLSKNPDEAKERGDDWKLCLNPESIEILIC